MNTLTENLYIYRNMLFPQSIEKRVLIHLLFWVFFIVNHLLFFIPDFADRIKEKQALWAYILYYGRFIPIFYLTRIIYRTLGTIFTGLTLFISLLFGVLAVTHLTTIIFYQYCHVYIGFQNLPGNFSTYGMHYLTPFSARARADWFVLIYDLLEMQFLVLPLGLKIIKYAVGRKMEEISQQKDKVQSELDYLRAQLTPHFIFNMLNAVQAEVGYVNKKASRYLGQAADLIRFTLYEARQELILLKKELRFIQQFIDLVSLRTSRRSEILFEMRGEVLQKHRIPTLLLLSLIENAFKHSVHATNEISFVNISSVVSEDWLDFRVANSKPQLSVPSGSKKQHGIGLENIRRTLALHFPGMHALDISETKDKFSVIVKIPL